eukprot:TRINITY_DN64860_c0_g1_i1.p1 TRINITY_DN64860_c0_g1~~TRINITY_DN64860_c0_g1_i1.p1  ORF type:complete len:563 (+),score=86.29 TRINITY_DN64860_c0_g1_i1:46-1734(+)
MLKSFSEREEERQRRELQEKQRQRDEVDNALKSLFAAYDLDDSGELTRCEYLRIETRIQFSSSDHFSENTVMANISKADRDCSGTIDFEEFRDRQMQNFCERDMTREEIVKFLAEHTKKCHLERVRMGVRYNAEVRHLLKQIFTLFDVSGDGQLSPDEWISAQKCIAIEVCDVMDEEWLDQADFGNADADGDGQLSEDEFLEQAFSMFEGVKKNGDEIVKTLQRITMALRNKLESPAEHTQTLDVMVQTAEAPSFQPPRSAWQDEPTADDDTRNAGAWKRQATICLPLTLNTLDDITGALRLVLQLPQETWLSVFFKGPRKVDSSPITLLRGSCARQGNIESALAYLAKPHACPRLYVKNVRKRPSKLVRQNKAFLDEREVLLSKLTGASWGIDWETQLIGEGAKQPYPLELLVGDALIVEVPLTDDHCKFRFVSTIFMDGCDVLSRPIDQNVAMVTKKKSKKKTSEQSEPPDELQKLSFVALAEGTCVLFVEVSWEDQEEVLAAARKLEAPVAENTIARIGPMQVTVKKMPSTARKRETGLQWWNGVKWGPKKGPAKTKHK